MLNGCNAAQGAVKPGSMSVKESAIAPIKRLLKGSDRAQSAALAIGCGGRCQVRVDCVGLRSAY